MYYVNKIVGWCLSPFGMLFLGLASGFALCRVKRWKWREAGRLLIGLSLVLMWVLGCGITTRLVGVPLEGDERAVSRQELEGCAAIVVLGGGVGIHGQCGRVELFSGADRIWEGVRLWRSLNAGIEGEACGGVPLILGGGADERIEPLLRDFGVPRQAWSSVDQARNTEEEARLIQAVLCASRSAEETALPKLRIALVTSAWHMPRAKMLFERAGFEVVPAPTDFEMHAAQESGIRIGDFFPNSDALLRNSCAIKEWVARFGYALLRR